MCIENFKWWCYKVLPLVYDDSLSYYELLCKVISKLNEIIDSENATGETIVSIQKALQEVQEWITKFDTSYVEELIREYLAKSIYVKITESGHIVYVIPDSWKSIQFNTTGLDISPEQFHGNDHYSKYDYGHLVLSY